MINKVLIFNTHTDNDRYLKTQLSDIGYHSGDIYVCSSIDELPSDSTATLDVILFNTGRYDASTLNVLITLKAIYPGVAIVLVIPATDDAYIPVKIIREGIDNYLLNDVFTAEILKKAIENISYQKKLVANCHNVTQDLLTVKKSFIEEKNVFNTILSSIEEVIWAVDPATLKLVYTNEACFNVYGYSAQEMIEDETIFFKAIHAEDVNAFHASLKDIYATGVAASEFRVCHKNGTIKTLKGHATVKYDDEGQPLMLSGITLDITELRATEKTLREQIDQTRTQNDALREIAWIQSHKMRKPIASIKGLIQLFNYEKPADAANIEVLKKFESLSNEIDEIIKDINHKTNCHGHQFHNSTCSMTA